MLTFLSEAYRRGQFEALPSFVWECLICDPGGLRASNRPCVRQLSASQKYPDDTRIAAAPSVVFVPKKKPVRALKKPVSLNITAGAGALLQANRSDVFKFPVFREFVVAMRRVV